MKIQCPVCNKKVDEKLFDYHRSTEEHLLEKIAAQYPAWSENREKILWYYLGFVQKSCICKEEE